MAKNQGLHVLRPKLLFVAVASCFITTSVLANPTGHKVVHGTVSVDQVGNLLKITNSPNAIINWQSFSIGANEITRFIQQSQASAVLNRVTGTSRAGATSWMASKARSPMGQPASLPAVRLRYWART